MTTPRKNMTGGRTAELASADATVSVGLAQGLIDFALKHGADRAELLRRAELDPSIIADPDERLPLESYKRLVRTAKVMTGDPALPLRFGSEIDMALVSPLGLLLHASPTIADIVEKVNHYGPVLIQVASRGGDRFEQVQRNGKIWIVDTRLSPNSFPELTEATFARFVGSTRLFGMGSFVAEVHVSHARPDHAKAYDEVFGAPTRFSTNWNAMRVDEAWLSHPVQIQPTFVAKILSAHTDLLLERLDQEKTVRGQVERMLTPILHTANIRMETLASALGCSSDTLYRRLRAEGVTFEELLDNLRRKTALHYLEDASIPISQIAYLTGFSEPAAFSRAFKRWTGRRPRSNRAVPPDGVRPLD